MSAKHLFKFHLYTSQTSSTEYYRLTIYISCFLLLNMKIKKYLADVVTATNSMNNVSAQLTTIGYSFEFREIQMIKVSSPTCTCVSEYYSTHYTIHLHGLCKVCWMTYLSLLLNVY